MKIVLDAYKFKEKIKDSMLAAGVKTSLPILSSIKMESLPGNKLKMTTYDLSIAIENEIQCDLCTDGCVCVEAKKLSDVVSRCKAETIEINVEGNICKVKVGKALFQIPTMDASEYPSLPETGELKEIKTDSQNLIDSAKNVSYAVSMNDTKPIITGVCFDFKPLEINIVALDGFRLAKRTIKSNDDREIRIVIPSETVGIVGRVASAWRGEMSIYASRHFVVFEIGDTRVTSRLLQGEYFDWAKAIPSVNQKTVVFNREELTDTIEMAMAFMSYDKRVASPIVFSFEKGKVGISTKNVAGAFDNEIDCESDLDENIDIAMNMKYLLDAVKSITGEKVVMKIQGCLNPVVLKEENSEDSIHLVLPVRLKK